MRQPSLTTGSHYPGCDCPLSVASQGDILPGMMNQRGMEEIEGHKAAKEVTQGAKCTLTFPPCCSPRWLFNFCNILSHIRFEIPPKREITLR